MLSLPKDVSPGSKSTGVPFFIGEYDQASQLFADENQEESKHNDTSFDLLLRYQASSYCSGEKHGRRAQDVKRELLNECHSLLCQEVNKQWLVIPGRRSERRPRMYALSFIAMPLASPPLSYRRHPYFRTHASARCTFIRSRLRARASTLTQAHDACAYAAVRSRLRARAWRLTVKQTSQTVVSALFASHEGQRRWRRWRRWRSLRCWSWSNIAIFFFLLAEI